MCWQRARITHNAPKSFIGMEMWVVAISPITATALDPDNGKIYRKIGQYCTNVVVDDTVQARDIAVARRASDLMFVPSDDVELLPCFAEDVSIIPYHQWCKQRIMPVGGPRVR